jgi:iron complex transport system substrate-binding protein
MPASASILLASAAIRVASLDLCADEYLLLLARPAEIASVSRLSHDPADSALWRSARRFPAHGGGLEQILGKRPTLLLVTGGGGRGTAAIAGKAGIRVLTLPYPQTISDVEAAMVRVARALGDPARANDWRRRLARLRAMPVPQRDSIFLGGGGMSVPAGSLAAQWMALGGFQQRALPGGRATLELLATRPPAVLLRSSYRVGQMSLGQRWLDHPLARRSPARTVATDGRAWTCAGPLMLGEIERLRGLG